MLPPSPPPPAPPPQPPSLRALRRSTSERMLGGVAGGIAQTYAIDVALVRIGFVIATFLGGLGVVLYGVAWLVVPEEDTDAVLVPRPELRGNATQITAFVVLGLGALLVFGRLVPDNGPGVFSFFWPVALIAGGVAIMLTRVRDSERVEPAPAGPPVSDAPDGTDAPRGATAAEAGTDEVSDVDYVVDDAVDTADTSDRTEETEAATQSAWTQSAPWPLAPTPGRPPRPPRPARPRSFVGPLVFSALLLYAGVTALLDSTDAVDVDFQVAVAIAVLIVGAGLLASVWFGRARSLIPVGVFLTIPLAALAVVDVPFEGGAGDRLYDPVSRAELETEYRLGAGQMTIDLRELDLTGTATVEASVAFGELELLVPDDLTIEVDAKSGAGAVYLFGREEEGLSVEGTHTVRGPEGAGRVELDLEVGMGSIRVERYAAERGSHVTPGDETIVEGSG